mgnify:CR=1 FL=1
MSAHHWIQGHCTTCGVKREKVRVQGQCFVASKPVAKHYASLDPHNIRHVVAPASLGDNDAFASVDKADVLAKQVREVINDAGKECGKILFGEARPYAQNPLFQMTPSKRSIEPHKKRREK